MPRLLPLILAALALLPACNHESSRTEPFPPNEPMSVAPPISVPTAPPSSATIPEIRVALLKDAPSLRLIAPASGARIVLNGQPWRKLVAGATVNVTFSGPAILLEGQPANAASVRFESLSSSESLKINDRDTAPTVSVSKPANRSGLLAIAQLSMEEYLAGVLAGEVPYERWHTEALKTQAVVSRTFALYELRGHTGEAYDVDSTIMSQVFRPGFRNIPTLIAAVQATRGQVLTSSGQLFPAYFHSTCGGQTAPAAGVFPEFAGVKPLCGGVNCPYCKISPSYRWSASFSKEQIAAKLRAQYPTLGKIESISFMDAKGPIGASPSEFRRVLTVAIKHSNGVTTMQGNAFRLAVSPKDLKSLLFGQIADSGDTLTIAGGGFGHGVGLCQYGSQGMAQSGQPYTSILGFYFPGAALTRMY